VNVSDKYKIKETNSNMNIVAKYFGVYKEPNYQNNEDGD
jgi:hypothetical protein